VANHNTKKITPEFARLLRERLRDRPDLLLEDGEPDFKKIALGIGQHLGRYYDPTQARRVYNGEYGRWHLAPEVVDAHVYTLGESPSTGFDRAAAHHAVYAPPGVSVEDYRRMFRPLTAVAS